MTAKRKQAGFSAIEVLVVIAIASSLVIAAIGAANNLQENARVTQAVQDVGLLRSSVSAWAAPRTNLAGVSLAELDDYLPGHLKPANAVNSTVVMLGNPFGGMYNVANTSPTTYTIQIDGIPSAQAVNKIQSYLDRTVGTAGMLVTAGTGTNQTIDITYEF